jgi:hypothetical protein
MAGEHLNLPDDLEALKALILAQQALLDERAVEIERLNLLIAKLKRLQFGRRSEKLDRKIEQLELRLEELQVSAAPSASAAAEKRERQVPARRARAGVRLSRLRGDHAQDWRGRL